MPYVAVIVNDQRLRAAVIERLGWDPRIDTTKIAVVATAGEVTLTGSVRTYVERCRCVEIAKRIRGVTAVRDNLEVRVTIGDYRTDATLQHLASIVIECVALLHERPDVTVRDGMVTLTGDVAWAFERRTAEAVIAQIAGVRGIHNRIRIVPRVRAADDLQSILQRRCARRRSVEVSVDGARVTVAGNVRTCEERDDILDLAWSAPGVSVVEDRLKVRV